MSLSLGDNHVESLRNDNSEIGDLQYLIKLCDLNLSGNPLGLEDVRSILIQSLPSLKYFNNVKISIEERLTNTPFSRHTCISKTYLLQAKEVIGKEGVDSEDLLALYKNWDEQLTLLEGTMEQALKEMEEKIDCQIQKVLERTTREGIPSSTAINDEVILARNICDMISTTNSTFDETIGNMKALNAQTFQMLDENIQQNDGYEQVKLIMTQRTTLFKDQIASYLNAYESISMKHHRERMLSFKPK